MINRILKRLLRRRIPSHGCDWQAMGFDPNGEILGGFDWDQTPEGWDWWADNEDTREGWDRHDAMKRLYAADHRCNAEAMKQSARNMTGPED